MAHDPFNTPGDRFRAVFRYWQAYLLIAVLIALVIERDRFASSGKDHLVAGEVMRIETRPGKPEQALVRVNSLQQTTVALPASAHCHSGSKIRLVRHDDVAQHAFRAADPPCAG
ncbi:MAG TPA: hypothetical protein PK217_02190 [Sphingopyxis terrae]|nr:hypothetical protein [Sphingopyxis terrae]